MADKHDTGNARPAKIHPTERRLTVGTIFCNYRRKTDLPTSARGFAHLPWLQLKGRWLEAAGFKRHTPVRVQVEPGRLVITVAED